MTIILNCDILDSMISNDEIKIIKRSQNIVGNSNYYFNPNIGIKLYNPEVKFIDKKFVVFYFDKYKHSSLLKLLKHMDAVLQNFVKCKYSELFDKKIYSIFSEDDMGFTIRCYLPNRNGKYNIQTETQTIRFTLPRLGCIYDVATIEFRNIWKNGDKYGFNIELKGVNVSMFN